MSKATFVIFAMIFSLGILGIPMIAYLYNLEVITLEEFKLWINSIAFTVLTALIVFIAIIGLHQLCGRPFHRKDK